MKNTRESSDEAVSLGNKPSARLNSYIDEVYKGQNLSRSVLADIRETRYAIRIGYEGVELQVAEAMAEQIIEKFKERHQKGKPYAQAA